MVVYERIRKRLRRQYSIFCQKRGADAEKDDDDENEEEEDFNELLENDYQLSRAIDAVKTIAVLN